MLRRWWSCTLPWETFPTFRDALSSFREYLSLLDLRGRGELQRGVSQFGFFHGWIRSACACLVVKATVDAADGNNSGICLEHPHRDRGKGLHSYAGGSR